MKKKLILIGVVSVLVLGCIKKGPVACFVEPIRVLEINTPILFEDCSEEATSYFYSFGDDKSSIEKSPIHSYSIEGEYTVKLIVANRFGGEDELIRTINVYKIPVNNLAVGEYSGKYVETYAANEDLDTTYDGSCEIKAIGLKEMVINFSQGSFETTAIGKNTKFSFSTIRNPSPQRISNLERVTGSYINTSQSLTFTLSGTDNEAGDIVTWEIRFTGKKN